MTSASKHRIAVYPGTFDPITHGHTHLVERAAKLFDTVIVAVAVAHHKKTLFTLAERLEMTAQVLAHVGVVKVMSFDGLLRDFCLANGAHAVVRGVRGVTDFEFEANMAGMNRELMPEVETLFLTPAKQHQFTSSTFVREIASLGGDVTALVSPTVVQNISKKLK
jgi:pantetheine-phosphate adenylyltransferase